MIAVVTIAARRATPMAPTTGGTVRSRPSSASASEARRKNNFGIFFERRIYPAWPAEFSGIGGRIARARAIHPQWWRNINYILASHLALQQKSRK
jgi:hypothetical protein